MERITAAEKVTAVQRHLKDGESYKSIGKLLGVDESVIRDWCRIYESIGPEGFWGILKRERYYKRRFTSREDVVNMITNYIEYYNNKRYQRRLGVLTPIEKHSRYLLAT